MSQFVYYYNPLDPQDVSARALVLSLMSSTDASPQAIGRLINAAALFGIEASTLRVAVTRLMKDGLLESPERGVYSPGPKAQALMVDMRCSRRAGTQSSRSAQTPFKGGQGWLILQFARQRSFSLSFASSQASPSSITPFPQIGSGAASGTNMSSGS